jgi:prolipoprotein diacylglyceryl transferase
MLPILQVGPLALQVPGLILLIGLWLGLSLAERHARRFKTQPEQLYNLVLITLLAGILGARLTYVLRFSAAFTANPASLISLNPGLLDPIGGVAAGLIAGFVYGQRKKMALWSTSDALTPVLGVIGVTLGLANLASGSGFGAATDLPWAIELWGESRHPSQIYEIVAAGVILWLVWPSRTEKRRPSGWLFLQFLALSAGARLFLEAFRGDSLVILNGLRATQVAAWAVLAAALWGIWQLQSNKKG